MACGGLEGGLILRLLLPSKIELAVSGVVLGYPVFRDFYLNGIPVIGINTLVDLARNPLLVVGRILLSILVLLIMLPLLSALPQASPETTPVPPPPNDEESLVPDSETPIASAPAESSRRFPGFSSLLGAIFLLAFTVLQAVALASASSVRPRGKGILQGTLQVLMTATAIEYAGMVTAVILYPPLLVSDRFLIFWAIAKRRTIAPRRCSWDYVIMVCTWMAVSLFLYLLAIEGIILSRPAPLEAFIPHIVSQAVLLSELYKWLGSGAYACGTLWFFTVRTAKYFIVRALRKLSPERMPPLAPRPTYYGLARRILLPIVMSCHGYFHSASFALEGLVSAALVIAWITAGVLALFLFDVLVY
ncbi:hypothetical protein FB451DRAFT_1267670 [Mycena latifolia]|nr:hypothetical protein FB451DRAFT_1267670 [Mycena latifolia]